MSVPDGQPQISETDRFLFKYLGVKSPVVPAGCIVTAAILGTGFYEFQRGNKKGSQFFMRARVISQGITLGAMMLSLYVSNKQKRLGLA